MFFSSDDIVAVTVNGKTFIAYNETSPFLIKYFGLAAGSNSEDARFYYNCSSNQSSEVSVSSQFS